MRELMYPSPATCEVRTEKAYRGVRVNQGVKVNEYKYCMEIHVQYMQVDKAAFDGRGGGASLYLRRLRRRWSAESGTISVVADQKVVG
jgi:hypothetical protein